MRRNFETGYYFKEYAEYNLLDKAYLGFSTTMNQFLHTLDLVTAVIIALCVGVSCWNALKREKMWVLYLLVMLVGVASRIMLGFSASIYASGDRTMLFLYFGFIFTTIHLIKNNQEKFDFLYNRWWMSGLMVLSVILIWTNYRSMY